MQIFICVPVPTSLLDTTLRTSHISFLSLQLQYLWCLLQRNLTVCKFYLQDPKFHFDIPIDYWHIKQNHVLIFSSNMCGHFIPTNENYVMSPMDWSTNDRRLTFAAWPITDVAKQVCQRCHSMTQRGDVTGIIQTVDMQCNPGSRFLAEERRRYPPRYTHVYKILPKETYFLILCVK